MNQTQFRVNIRKSLADDNLQIALDNNTERRLKGRALAFASLPDWRERRQRAHAVRAEVIANLDDYLGRFISNAQDNGIIVHRAKDADEAIRIVLDIAREMEMRGGYTGRQVDTGRPNPQLLIAKSKSMVSEEVNFNHALEGQNIRVVETDLGEYIVQLRGERPSHIITPAVHLRRADVGKLFQEKLGIPYTEDIPVLTNTARKVLREVFLTADIGFSGVNFGVAETGAFCIVTNEGNGRMVTTLPRVHIALMGMERLVPTLDDLALMLSLLPRSATGQKLSVYTQIIRRPLDGQTRHLIVLDNGRSRLRASPLKESLYCIRCGACLNACPVFREIGGHAYASVYPGPIGSVISAGLFGSDFVSLAQASSLCGACKEACPVDIDLPKLLTRVRAGQAPDTRDSKRISSSSGFFLRIYSRVARDPRLFAASQKFAAVGSALVSPFSRWIRMPAFTGWGYASDFPRFAGKTFRERWDDEKKVDTEASRQGNTETSTQVDTKTNGQVGDLSAQFTNELNALGGHVVETDNPAREIMDFLKTRGVDRIHLEPNVLDESILRQSNIDLVRAPDPSVRVGVTKALCALADTGSILITDGEGHPLHASLLPEIHLAVLKKSDILPTLADAMDKVRATKSAVFISGPSRTADIEMTLTIGVHGPGELHVFLAE